MQEALAAAMNNHIGKPINFHELYEVLGRWITVDERRINQGYIPGTLADRSIEVAGTLSDQDNRRGRGEAAGSIPKLPGIDTMEGLRRVGGNPALYLKILRNFRDTQADTVQRVEAAFGNDDREPPAVRRTHLKE